MKNKNSSLFSKYLSLFEKSRTSRVFAPLAESYRKLNMYEEAFLVLKEGLSKNPDYPLGYIVLAQCYYDKKKYELAYQTILPWINKEKDNLLLQRVFAKTCEKLGLVNESLKAYKYLLYVSPLDKELAVKVTHLEKELWFSSEQSEFLAKESSNNYIDPKSDLKIHDAPFEADEENWIHMDFNPGNLKLNKSDFVEDSDAKNNTQRSAGISKEFHSFEREQSFRELDDEFYHEEYDNPDNGDENASLNIDKPIITHTLVDLFLKQGHKDKAVEILKGIVELHPNDLFSLKRLKELKGIDENEKQHEELISLVEKTINLESSKKLRVEKLLKNFLDQIVEQKMKKSKSSVTI